MWHSLAITLSNRMNRITLLMYIRTIPRISPATTSTVMRPTNKVGSIPDNPESIKRGGAWVLIQIEVAAIAAAARAKFAGQQPDQRQLGPLPKPEGLEKLFPGVFKGRINRIHGGESQARTSASIECEGRYCKRTNVSNKFCSEDNPLRLLTEICSAASNALR